MDQSIRRRLQNLDYSELEIQETIAQMQDSRRVDLQEQEHERALMLNCKHCGHLTTPRERVIEAGYFYHLSCLKEKRRKGFTASDSQPAYTLPASQMEAPNVDFAPSRPAFESGGGGNFGGGGASSSWSDSSSSDSGSSSSD